MASAALAGADAPPFTDARRAVRFAMTRVGRPGVPAITRMMGGARLADHSWEDAAAQAGMIMAALHPLGVLKLNALIASAAPRRLRCDCGRPCCARWRVNWEWHLAVTALARDAHWLLKTRTRDELAVIAIIAKLYGKRTELTDVAQRFRVDLDVVTRYHSGLNRWLVGADGVEAAAWREAEELLREVGIVGEA